MDGKLMELAKKQYSALCAASGEMALRIILDTAERDGSQRECARAFLKLIKLCEGLTAVSKDSRDELIKKITGKADAEKPLHPKILHPAQEKESFSLLPRYKLFDVYDYRELLGRYETMDAVRSSARQRIEDTDGECSLLLFSMSKDGKYTLCNGNWLGERKICF